MLRKLIILLLFISYSFANEHVISIAGTNYSENEFFEFYPKTEWERITQKQKERIMTDFIRKKTAYFSAKDENFLNNPRTAIKLRNRFDFLYVNKTYEKLVALPLVPQDYIELGKIYILKDLNISHILIGYTGCEMPGDFTRSKKDAYETASEILASITDSTDFEKLAVEFSEDPGASGNKGNLGWVSWGKVDPEFQKHVFLLSKNEYSDPIETKYGYHVVYIVDEKDSEAKGYPFDKLNERVEYSSLSLVKDQLKEAADNHDKNLLSDIGFKFNEPIVEKIGLILSEHQKKTTYMNNVDIIPVLKDYTQNDIVLIFNKKGYGIKWLINKLSKTAPSRRPSIADTETLKLALKTLVLQLQAIEKGKTHNLDNSYGFQSQYRGAEEEVLYDAYVRYLVNNAPEPTNDEMNTYYEKYKETKYKEAERYSVYNLKVKYQNLADSLYTAIENGSDFFKLANEFSLLSPKKSGKMHPFDKSKNKDIVAELKKIKPGKYTSVFKSRDKKWSIIYFEEIIPEEILSYERVKNRIKTALTKENQESHKENTFKNLNNKYEVSLNNSFFNFESDE